MFSTFSPGATPEQDTLVTRAVFLPGEDASVDGLVNSAVRFSTDPMPDGIGDACAVSAREVIPAPNCSLD